MRVFVVSQGQDTGGQGYRTMMGFKKHTDWDVQAMCAGETYIKFPYQHLFDWETAQRLYDRADVVEHQNWLYGYAMYERHNPGKPTLVRHHGSILRDDAANAQKETRSVGAVTIVSTVDLLADDPEATWFPNFYDLEALASSYPRKKSRILRIGHGPTVRSSKGTETILKGLNRLSRRYPFEVELTEKVTWVQSLKRKAWCDIWVDQLALGYGGSSIEAMNLGIPVISGWEEPADREVFEKLVGPVPFYHATTKDFEQRLTELILSPQLREEVGERGRAYVHQYHSDEIGVPKLKKLYESIPPSKGIDALWLRVDKEEVMRKWKRPSGSSSSAQHKTPLVKQPV